MTESTNRNEWLDQIKVRVQNNVGDQWMETSWSEFVKEVVWWLHSVESTDVQCTIGAAVGLIRYGINAKTDLQNISEVKKEFRETLREEGVRPAISDKLFKKYVALDVQLPTGTGEETMRVPGTAPPPPPALIDAVKQALDKWTGKAPSLKSFEIKQEAAFYNYRNLSNTIPLSPEDNESPSLLLYDLVNDSHKENAAYNYIHCSQRNGPIGMYGTSGAGKTRTAFEYLAQNYGLYFVVDKTQNPGSWDFTLLLLSVEKKLTKIGTAGSLDDKTRQEQSEKNLAVVVDFLETLVCVRKAVFHHVDEQLKSTGNGQGLSCHEWLLMQLYPYKFLGRDVFRDLCRIYFGQKYYWECAVVEKEMSCFVDEAQMLLEELDGYFLSKDGKSKRSAYSAFVKGLHELAVNGNVLFPCFSGTGLSIGAFGSETNSVMTKPANHSYIFTKLKTMTAQDVIEYMKKFLNFDKVKADLVNHVAKWLRGRPRWTATFLETFLVRKAKGMAESVTPPGCFLDTEKPIIASLNRYIEVVTESESQEPSKRRHSWSLGKRSAYSAMERLFQKASAEWSEAQREMRKATFDFTLSGRPSLVTAQAAKLIEYGVASVATPDSDLVTDLVLGNIDEPLIVQASINFFGLQKSLSEILASSTSASEQGYRFEQFVLPSIQARFSTVMVSQLKENVDALEKLKGYTVPKWSSYGVLALKCDKSSATMGWIDRAMASRFEGLVEPFCYPDTLFGPDVVFLMRSPDYKDFRFVASQAKFKNSVNQAEALRTLVPKLFYHQSRKANPVYSLKDEELETWLKLEKKLFWMEIDESPVVGFHSTRSRSAKAKAPTKKRKREMVRFVVQYPSVMTSSAKPGPVAFSEYKTCESGCNCKMHDLLVTIDVNNANDLLGKDSAAILKLVKKKPLAS
uniref:Uncharacterized protein n=1 Tax=Attheya septentrionalis TaxID=420275 RepID=A0A7S2XMP4_9STRA|mmetsp:Transcript_21303/g.38510  ORF Transcript_21303/g.38510 Transcript_21303/m.38510 type:complete len:908 (+) Transcript_21303:82-2805(+)